MFFPPLSDLKWAKLKGQLIFCLVFVSCGATHDNGNSVADRCAPPAILVDSRNLYRVCRTLDQLASKVRMAKTLCTKYCSSMNPQNSEPRSRLCLNYHLW